MREEKFKHQNIHADLKKPKMVYKVTIICFGENFTDSLRNYDFSGNCLIYFHGNYN